MKLSQKVKEATEPSRALDYEIELTLRKLGEKPEGNKFMSSFKDSTALLPSDYELYGVRKEGGMCKIVSDIRKDIVIKGCCNMQSAITCAALVARGM